MRLFSTGRFVAALAIMLFAGCIAAGQGRADEVRVAFVTHGQPGDPYWTIIRNGMNDAATKLGVTVDYKSPSTFSTEEMRRLIDAAVASRPDGLVVSMPDEAALSSAVEAATKAGIPVIIIDAGGPTLAKKLGALFFMGQFEFGTGLAAGRRAHEVLAKHPLCIDHEVGNVALEARRHGFSSGFGFAAPVLKSSLDPVVARKALTDYLAQNPDTDFILTLGSASAEVALEVIRTLPADTRPRLGTFDLSPKVLDGISSGDILWGIDAQPFLMGYVPVMTFNLLKRYRLAPIVTDNFYPTGPSFVEPRDATAMRLLSEAAIR
jgi:simple sugar transport system substrate-binding protein